MRIPLALNLCINHMDAMDDNKGDMIFSRPPIFYRFAENYKQLYDPKYILPTLDPDNKNGMSMRNTYHIQNSMGLFTS